MHNTVKKFLSQIIFLVLFWLLYGTYIIHSAYFKNIYISPDSSNYLREAEAITQGYGFNYNGMAGGHNHFALWPVGYPVLIALSQLIFRCNGYLASKIITILLIAFELFILARRYKSKSWLYALVLSNYGIISINRYTWSEVPFSAALLVYTLALSEITSNENCSIKHYIILAVSMICAFLSRYFGALTVMTSLLTVLILFYFSISDKSQRTSSHKKRILKLSITSLISGFIMFSYLLFNKVMCGYSTGMNRAAFTEDIRQLTVTLIKSILYEAQNIFSILAYHLHLSLNYWLVIIIPVLIIFIYVIAKKVISCFRNKHLDDSAIFFLVGICYYAAFIIIRFRSTMDPFSYRFWAPASMLILMGLVSCFCDTKLLQKSVKLLWTGGGAKLLITLFLISRDIKTGLDNPVYSRIKSEINFYLQELPSGTVILMCNDKIDNEGKRHNGEEFYYGYANYFRTDLVTVGGWSNPLMKYDSLDALKKEYRDYKYIAVSKFALNNELKVNRQSYSETLLSSLELLADQQQSQSNRKFVIININ